MQFLIRCALTGDLVLLNNLLASRGIEADHKIEVRLWHLALQGAYFTRVPGEKVVCLVPQCLEPCGSVSCCAVQGKTPLYAAALSGHLEIVQSLLAHGADVAMRCSNV